MRAERVQQFVFRDGPLGRRHDIDYVPVRDRSVDQQSGGVDVGHDLHQVNALVVGHWLDSQEVYIATVSVSRVGDATDDSDDHLLDAGQTIQCVYGSNETGGIAGGELQVVLADAFLVVGISMEEGVGNFVFLTSLEDGFDAVFRVEVLVLGPDSGG